jgi:3-oxoacyl-[acyl-carrier protein] reductase
VTPPKLIPFAALDNLNLEACNKIRRANLAGPMRLIKAVAPIMKAPKGRQGPECLVRGWLGPRGSPIAPGRTQADLPAPVADRRISAK